jgi:hypothetical protein
MDILKKFSKTKPNWEKPFSEKVAKRVAKIPTLDLEMWAEQAIYDIGRCLSSYQKHRDDIYLNEALVGSEALHAVINELGYRTSKPKNL